MARDSVDFQPIPVRDRGVVDLGPVTDAPTPEPSGWRGPVTLEPDPVYATDPEAESRRIATSSREPIPLPDTNASAGTNFWSAFGDSIRSFGSSVSQSLFGGAGGINDPHRYDDLTRQLVGGETASQLLASDDPVKRAAGRRMMEVDLLRKAENEGLKVGYANQRNPSAGYDPSSTAAKIGGIAGSTAVAAPSIVFPQLAIPTISAFGAQGYQEARDAYRDTAVAQRGDYDPNAETAIGLAGGAINGLLSVLPIKGISSVGKGAIARATKSAVEGGTGWRTAVAKELAKLVPAGAGLGGAQGAGTAVADEILRMTYDDELRAKYHEDPSGAFKEAAGRISEAAGWGAVGGAALGGLEAAHQGLGAAVTRNRAAWQINPQGAQQAPIGPAAPETVNVPYESLVKSAFGEGYAEAKSSFDVQRVARPEAVKALKDAGLWPTSDTPDDVAIELASNPKFGPIVDALRRESGLSRSMAEAFFGKDLGSLSSAKERTQWREIVLELHDQSGTAAARPPADVPVRITERLPTESPEDAQRPMGYLARQGIAAGPVPNPGEVSIRNGWFMGFRTRGDDEIIKLEKAVTDIQRSIRQELPDDQNPVQSMRLKNSRAAKLIEDHVKQPLESVVEDMKKAGIDKERVILAMMAEQAPYANEIAAKRNPDEPTVTGGMSNEFASQLLAAERAKPDWARVKEFADRLRKIADERLNFQIDAGTATPETVEALRSNPDYVPLWDNPDDADSAVAAKNRKRYSVGKKQFFERTGRTEHSLENTERAKEVADNALPAIVSSAMTAYQRGLANMALNDFRRMLEAHPNKGVGKVRYDTPIVRKITNGQAESVHMQPREFRDTPGVVHGTLDQDIMGVDKKGNEIVVHPRGTEFYIEVNDKQLAHAIKRGFAPEEGSLADWAFKMLRYPTRWVRITSTNALNLGFPLVNVERDIQTALASIASDPTLPKFTAAEVLKNVPAAFAAFAGRTKGPMAESRKLYEKWGGRQSIAGPREFKAVKREIEELWNPTTMSRAKDFGRKIIQAGEALGAPFENATRLALFHTMIERGVSPKKAAVAAREVTVDFEKHGTWSGILRAGYAFANAGIQGNVKIAKIANTRAGKMILGGYFLAGFYKAAQRDQYATTDSNGDGVPDIAEMPEYLQNSVLPIPIGNGKVFKVTVGWGLNVPFQMGESVYDMLVGNVDKTEATLDITKAIMDAANPLGGMGTMKDAHGVAAALAPNALDPLVDLAFNKDQLGRQIALQPFPGQEAGWVASENPMIGTGQGYVEGAKLVNRLTGGDEATPGAVNIAPEHLRYLANFMGGGIFRTGQQIATLMVPGLRPDEGIRPRDIPGVSRFIHDVPDRSAIRDRYLKIREEARGYEAQMKGYESRGDVEKARAVFDANYDTLRSVDEVESEIRSLRQQMKQADADGDRELYSSLLDRTYELMSQAIRESGKVKK